MGYVCRSCLALPAVRITCPGESLDRFWNSSAPDDQLQRHSPRMKRPTTKRTTTGSTAFTSTPPPLVTQTIVLYGVRWRAARSPWSRLGTKTPAQRLLSEPPPGYAPFPFMHKLLHRFGVWNHKLTHEMFFIYSLSIFLFLPPSSALHARAHQMAAAAPRWWLLKREKQLWPAVAAAIELELRRRRGHLLALRWRWRKRGPMHDKRKWLA